MTSRRATSREIWAALLSPPRKPTIHVSQQIAMVESAPPKPPPLPEPPESKLEPPEVNGFQ